MLTLTAGQVAVTGDQYLASGFDAGQGAGFDQVRSLSLGKLGRTSLPKGRWFDRLTNRGSTGSTGSGTATGWRTNNRWTQRARRD